MLHGGALIAAMMVANLSNFLFNVYIGNKLSLENLGLVTLINTLWYIAAIFVNSFSSTINHRTAYLSTSKDIQAGISFWKITLRLGILAASITSIIWIVAIPAIDRFFQINNVITLFLFTPALLFGVIASSNRGFLQGNMLFQWTALLTLIEALSKLALAFVFVELDLKNWVFMSIPLSILVLAAISMPLSRKLARRLDNGSIPLKNEYQFPTLFYASSVMSGISSAVFLSMDIILVKHFFDPATAGAYALLSLVGKMIYFLGSFPAVFMLTLVSRTEGLRKNSKKIFYMIFGSTLVMVAVGFIGLGWFGNYFVPMLLGERTLMILDYLRNYAFAISLFTLANVIISYHLARKQYIFPVISLFVSIIMVVGIIYSHSSIQSVINVITAASLLGFSLIGLTHIFERKIKFINANFHDFIDAFTRPPKLEQLRGGGKRVLIFNWRDIKHKFAGGAEVYIHEIAKRMVERGDYVTIFCGNDGHSLRNENIDGIQIVRRGGFYLVYLWAFLYYFTQFRGEYDILIDCHNGIPFFTPLYVKEPVISVVHHIHQKVFRLYLPKPLAEFACFLERDLMPIIYRNINFVTVSPSSKKEMIEYGLVGKGIEIVYNGVDLKDYTPAVKSPWPIILYLGRLKAYKSIDVLIASFKLIIEKIPSASLVIAGSGEEESHLKRLANQLGIGDKVIFAGKVSEQIKIEFLQKAWVMVNPSFMEGWGITTIEANACGTPVIGADVSGLRDSIKNLETGYLVPHGDSIGFADKIIKVIEDGKLRTRMSENSVVWANNFSWSSASNSFSEIIKSKYKTT